MPPGAGGVRRQAGQGHGGRGPRRHQQVEFQRPAVQPPGHFNRAERADVTFAQFVLLTPFPGTVDFEKWAASETASSTTVDGVPLAQHWLIPQDQRPKLYTPHPTMSLEEIRVGTQQAWDRFYGWAQVWRRSRVVKSFQARLAFVLISKLYRQMYAGTGIATDSARVQRSARWARLLGTVCRKLFLGKPMPELAMPVVPVLPAER